MLRTFQNGRSARPIECNDIITQTFLQSRSWGASLLRMRRRQFQWTVVVLDDVQLDVIDDFFDHPLPGRAPIFGPSAKHENSINSRFHEVCDLHNS